ncbi:1-deoxy-D-xylulose-5-phosphate synthase [Gammaproteobacteria bacterium]|nr:1-deoxy-D-xylulose-5-phosphate synthase [Gammaproteobacteria bacterium]
MKTTFTLLDLLDDPSDLRLLKINQLPKLAAEIRAFLIKSVSSSGGHFASNLGAVELSIALHYVFDTPNDSLIWDVGHQAYVHKILTKRKAKLSSIRQKGGLAPFPSRFESKYDAFGVGHSSTSISAALGMAIAYAAQNKRNQAIAIIGDGAMTAGQAFEALNHAGGIGANILVILNDNDMSISPNVGALQGMLTRALSNPILQEMRQTSKNILENLPRQALNIARKAEEHLKDFVTGGIIFEELGFKYFGPIDGHDLDELVATLENLKSIPGPKLLHVATKKGKGYAPAERNPIEYHAVSPFDPEIGIVPATANSKEINFKIPKKLTYTQVFSDWLCYKAALEDQLVAITPAMREGSGLVAFSKSYPSRYFDTAIAEQHAVTLAAGMACAGLKPVLAIYSTFLQRGFDQLIHDVAVQNLPVIFALDRAGIVGPDGATHAGSFDLSFLRAIPNLIILAPSDEQMLWAMLNSAYAQNCPVAIRYPRGNGRGISIADKTQILPIACSEMIFEGGFNYKIEHTKEHKKISLLVISIGSMFEMSECIASFFDASLMDLRCVKPLDGRLLTSALTKHDFIITIEDNAISGGAGSAIHEWMSENDIYKPIKHFGLADIFPEHGERAYIMETMGLSSDKIITSVSSWLAKNIQNRSSDK